MLVSSFSFSQVNKDYSLFVIDKITKATVPFATAQLKNNNLRGFVADIHGKILINREQYPNIFKDTIIFKSLGYFEKKTVLKKSKNNKYVIKLNPTNYKLKEIIVLPPDNIALKVIKKVISNKKINSPAAIDEFSCTVYNKTIVNIEPNREYISDSLLQKIEKKQEKHNLFIAEKISEKKYKYGVQENEALISYRISGFKNPNLDDISTQIIQPFHFYHPLIRLYENNYINPISRAGIANYYYHMKDTLLIDEDSLYVIEYVPRSVNKSLLKGVLYISAESYAIVDVTAKPAIEDLVVFNIEQKYHKVSNHYLPQQLNYGLVFKKYPNKKLGIRFNSYSQVYNYDFSKERLNNKVEEINKIPIDSIRFSKLTKKEMATYQWMDSIGEAKNFDGKLNFFKKISEYKIPFKIADFDISETSFNQQEHTRIGIGVYTNEKVFRHVIIGGYGAYGFRDKKIKYGSRIQVNLPNKKTKLIISYKKDLLETGVISGQYHKINILQDLVKDSLNEMERYNLSVQKDFKHISVTSGLRKEKVKDNFFDFNTSNFTEVFLSARINFNSTKQKFFDYDNATYKYPVFFINYFKGIKWINGDYNYDRLNITIDYGLFIERLGRENFHLSISKIFAKTNIPYYKLISGYGALINDMPIYVKNNFQTIFPYEFIQSESVVLHFRHHFIKPVFYSKISEPIFSLTQSVGYGKLSAPFNYSFKTFKKGYFETGVIINNIVKVNYVNFAYIGMGAGVFYHYGAYADNDFNKNLVYKLSLSVLF